MRSTFTWSIRNLQGQERDGANSREQVHSQNTGHLPLSLTTPHPTPQQGWTRSDPVPAVRLGLTRPASPFCQRKPQLLAWPCSPAHAQDRSLNPSRATRLPSSSTLRPRKIPSRFSCFTTSCHQSSKWVSTRLIKPDVPAHMQMSSNTKHTEDNLYSCSSAPC